MKVDITKRSLLLSLVVFFFSMTSYASMASVYTASTTNNSNTNNAVLYDFSQIPLNQLTDKIGMRFFTTPSFTVIQWHLKAGAKLPVHSHVNEQLTRVDQGQVQVQGKGENRNLTAGQMMLFPSQVSHGFTALEDSVLYEQQTPIRQDFLEPDFIQKLSDYLSKNQ